MDRDTATLAEPPVTKRYTDDEMRGLTLKHPCHNQVVERHIRVVSDAASKVCGHNRRDGHIRQKLKSRRLMKTVESKKQYTVSTE